MTPMVNDFGTIDGDAVGGLIKKIEHGTPTEKSDAIGNLRRVVPISAAEPAIPVLLRVARTDPDQYMRRNALWALGTLPVTDETIQVFREALNSPNSSLRCDAAQAMPATETYLPEIISGFQNADSQVRLELIGKFPYSFRVTETCREKILSFLKTALQDKHYWVRRNACEALAEIGGGFAEAGPLIANILKTERDCSVRMSAAKALARTGGATREDLPDLVKLMRTDFSHDLLNSRNFCAQIIGHLGQGATEAVPDLIYVIENDPDPAVRESALQALGRIGVGAEAALPVILEIIRNKSVDIRRQIAVEALGQVLRETNKDAIDVLIECLGERNEDMRSRAIEALTKFSINNPKLRLEINSVLRKNEERDPSSVETLIVMLQDADWTVRNSALERLYSNSRSAVDPRLVPYLVPLLKDQHQSNRYRAVQLLRYTGTDGKIAIDALIETVGSSGPDYNLKRWALECLINIHCTDVRVLKTLNKELLDNDLSHDAAFGLAKAGSQGLPYLLDALKMEKPYTIFAAAQALGTLGEKAKDAVPALLSLILERGHLLTVQPTCGAPNSLDIVLGALASIAPHNNEVLKTAIAISENEDYAVNKSAIEPLRKIGSSRAVEALTMVQKRNAVRFTRFNVEHEISRLINPTGRRISSDAQIDDDVRKGIISIIALEAMKGMPWLEASSEQMRTYNISIEEVEAEVSRRRVEET